MGGNRAPLVVGSVGGRPAEILKLATAMGDRQQRQDRHCNPAAGQLWPVSLAKICWCEGPAMTCHRAVAVKPCRSSRSSRPQDP